MEKKTIKKNKFLLMGLLPLLILYLISLTNAVTINSGTNFNSTGGINLSCDITSYCNYISVDANDIYISQFSLDNVNSISFNLTNIQNYNCSGLPYVNSTNNNLNSVYYTIPSSYNLNATIYVNPNLTGISPTDINSVTINGVSANYTSFPFSAIGSLNNGINNLVVGTSFTTFNSGLCNDFLGGIASFNPWITIFMILGVVVTLGIVGIVLYVTGNIGAEIQGVAPNMFDGLTIKLIFLGILVVSILLIFTMIVIQAMCSVT